MLGRSRVVVERGEPAGAAASRRRIPDVGEEPIADGTCYRQPRLYKHRCHARRDGVRDVPFGWVPAIASPRLMTRRARAPVAPAIRPMRRSRSTTSRTTSPRSSATTDANCSCTARARPGRSQPGSVDVPERIATSGSRSSSPAAWVPQATSSPTSRARSRSPSVASATARDAALTHRRTPTGRRRQAAPPARGARHHRPLSIEQGPRRRGTVCLQRRRPCRRRRPPRRPCATDRATRAAWRHQGLRDQGSASRSSLIRPKEVASFSRRVRPRLPGAGADRNVLRPPFGSVRLARFPHEKHRVDGVEVSVGAAPILGGRRRATRSG
jgi:hypothetical protein